MADPFVWLGTNAFENPSHATPEAVATNPFWEDFACSQARNIQLTGALEVVEETDTIALRCLTPNQFFRQDDILILARFTGPQDVGKKRIFVPGVGYCPLLMVIRG